ncbi:MAG: hypothetical protein L0220_08725 [Acidobacteria bacterium]|nr:hypothetical protein [Acidobacteriota bacterium]
MKPKIIYYFILFVVVILLGVAQLGCRSDSTGSSTSTSPSPAATQTPSPQVASQEATPAPAATVAGAPAPTGEPRSAPPETAAAPEKPAPTPQTFTLGAGRVISVYTSAPISTKTHNTGDTFVGSLSQSITDGNWVIARKGAVVDGVVTSSDPGGKVKGVASIAVALKTLTLADGRRVAISTNSFSKLAPTSRKKDAKKIGIGAGAGAVIGAIAGGGKGAAIGAGVGGGAGTAATLATRGDPAVIADESLLTFRLSSPVKVTKR